MSKKVTTEKKLPHAASPLPGQRTEPSHSHKRYVVFERTKGSKCWTIAHHEERNVPAQFSCLSCAWKWVADVHSKRRGWWGGKPNQRPMEAHIAEIDLPE